MEENKTEKQESQHTAVHVVVVPGAVVRNLARGARVPALAADPVVDVVPGDAVRATGAGVEVDRALAVSPERVEVPVVGAGAGLDAALEGLKRASRRGHGGGDGREEDSERDHDIEGGLCKAQDSAVGC